jgi:sec-independent protein translocase protein TatA
MGNIGMPEMLVILVIALIFFGPRKLPELGRSLGKSLNEFKKASNDLRSTLEDEIRVEEQKEQRAKTEAQRAAIPATVLTETSSVLDPHRVVEPHPVVESHPVVEPHAAIEPHPVAEPQPVPHETISRTSA